MEWIKNSLYINGDNIGYISDSHYLGKEYTENSGCNFFATFRIHNVSYSSHPLASLDIEKAKKEMEKIVLLVLNDQFEKVKRDYEKLENMRTAFLIREADSK